MVFIIVRSRSNLMQAWCYCLLVLLPSMGLTAGPAAQIGAEVISEEQLLYGIKNEIFELEEKIYQLKMDRLRAILLEKFLQQDPRKGNLTNDQFLQQFIAPNLQVTVPEVERFITTKEIPADQVNEQTRQRVQLFLLQEKRKHSVNQWLEEQMRSHSVKINFSPPVRPTYQVPVETDDPQWGKGRVLVMMVTDYQCLFSAKGAKILTQLQDHYGKKKIKVVLKNFPLPFHGQAPFLAEVALCAYQQNSQKFWPFFQDLYVQENTFSQKELLKLAQKKGINSAKIEACLAQKKMSEKVKKDQQLLIELGIKSTPTFLINGKVVNGVVDWEKYQQIVDAELASIP